MKTCTVSTQRQQGMALVIALILLIALTLLGLSAMDTVMMEMRLAKNSQERAYSFQMAETALREKESLFSDTNFMNILGIEADRTVTDADSVAGMNRPVPIMRDLDNNITSETVPGRTLMEYKGSFSIPIGAAGGDWGIGTASGNYFELMTRAKNEGDPDSTADDNQGIIMTVRSGYRQLAPSDKKVKYAPTSPDIGY